MRLLVFNDLCNDSVSEMFLFQLNMHVVQIFRKSTRAKPICFSNIIIIIFWKI